MGSSQVARTIGRPLRLTGTINFYACCAKKERSETRGAPLVKGKEGVHGTSTYDYEMPGVPSCYLLLVWPGAPSSVLVPMKRSSQQGIDF